MKAIPILAPGPAESLSIQDWPDPVIQPDEVLIEVRAFGLNFADVQARRGEYYDAPPMPFVPGYEVAGVIKAVGSAVSQFQPGQRVLALTEFNAYAQLACAKARACALLPESMSFAQGASIPVIFVTAYHLIHQTGCVLPGSRILIHAAAGGVGLAAVQIAKLAGCEIFGTAGSEAKLEILRAWNVDHPINYVEHDFVTAVQTLTRGEGVDIVLDPIGGRQIKQDLSLLRPHGRVVAFGAVGLAGRKGPALLKLLPQVLSMLTINLIDLMKNSKGIYGANLNIIGRKHPALLEHNLKAVLELFADGKLKTVISREYGWDQIARAQRELETRQSTGKIVLTIPD